MTPNWHTSTNSGGSGCIEVAQPDGGEGGNVLVRNSKDPCSPTLTFDPGTWAAFIEAVRGDGL